MSTPNGQLGWWYDAWVNGGDEWERSQVDASMCPRISEDFLRTERESLPTDVFAQEWLTQPRTPQGAVFRYEDIQSLLLPGTEAESGDSDAEDRTALSRPAAIAYRGAGGFIAAE